MSDYQKVNDRIRRKFHVKRGDTLPFSGWFDSRREHLFELMGEVGYTLGAEIGVCKGENALAMLRRIPGLRLLLVDPWTPYNRLSAERAKARFDSCVQRLDGQNVQYMKMTSMEAVSQVEDGSLDFVYIDGLHEFDPVMLDIIHWSRKVRSGGIVAGHDYYSFYQGGVMHAVNAYTLGHNVNEWYVTREKEPSWFWVKQ